VRIRLNRYEGQILACDNVRKLHFSALHKRRPIFARISSWSAHARLDEGIVKSIKHIVTVSCERCTRIGLLMLTVGWIVGIGAGLCALWSYAHDPGLQDESPADWPLSSQLRRPADKPVLVFFAHPRCPCTRASIRELERLLARVTGKVQAHVVFTQPASADDQWSDTDLQRSAAAIMGVNVFRDAGGVETDLFRARTSGLALLYSDSGSLLFHGGITPSRGHEGDNDGAASLIAAILDKGSRVQRTNVYGCPLQAPDTTQGNLSR
jgi:hypothetical protein